MKSEPQDKILKFDGILSIGIACFSNKKFKQTTLEFPDVTEIYDRVFSFVNIYKVVFGNVRKLGKQSFFDSSFKYLTINLNDLEESSYGAFAYLKIGIPDIQMPKNLKDLNNDIIKSNEIIGIDGFFENPITLNDYNHNVTVSSTKTDENFTTKCVVSGNVSQKIAFNFWCNDLIFDETVKEIKGNKTNTIWKPYNMV